MSKARFSWEPLSGGSLLLRITQADRDTTWKITKRTSIERIFQIFWEVQAVIDESEFERIPGVNAHPTPTEMEAVYGPSDFITEEMSHAALAAKARSVTTALGGNWFDNMTEESDDDLPLYTLGKGEPE